MLKKCKFCEELFMNPHYKAKYCSDECAYGAKKQNAAGTYHKRKGKKVVPVKERVVECVVCGKEFKPNNGIQTMCSNECRIIKRNKKK